MDGKRKMPALRRVGMLLAKWKYLLVSILSLAVFIGLWSLYSAYLHGDWPFGWRHYVIAAESDIDSSPRHIRRDGHGARHAGFGNDTCLQFIVFGIKDPAVDSGRLEIRRQFLRLLDTGRADEDWPAERVHFDNLLHDGPALCVTIRKDQIGVVHADTWCVRRNDQNLHAVKLIKFICARLRGCRHSAERGV